MTAPTPELLPCRPRPEPEDNPQYGCDHTESYIDEPHSIVCVAGWMIDVDVYTEGYHGHDFKHPCRKCNPIAFKQEMDERNNS